jgi:acetyl esterase/lipase
MVRCEKYATAGAAKKTELSFVLRHSGADASIKIAAETIPGEPKAASKRMVHMHKARLKAVLLAGLTALLSACSPFGVINAMVPRGGYHVRPGLAFGGDPRQKLDVYVPDKLSAPAPVLLFFYGGGWESGDRGGYKAFGQAFAARGIVTVVADYRLYPNVKFPAYVEDAAGALAYVHAHAQEYGGDPARIFVAGHSAGAYNAMMLASDPRYLKAVGGDLSWIRGVIGLAGPYDALPFTEQRYIDNFGGADNPATMPINHIDGPRPPMLLVTGTADTVVGPGNSDRMAAKLQATGNKVEVIKYPGVGHIGIILSLVPGFRGLTTLRDDITRFIQSH